MKFTTPAIALLSAPALASGYNLGPSSLFFSPTPSFRLATRSSPCRNNVDCGMGSIASDLAAARQQMRSDMVAARQQMNIMKPAYQMFDNGEQFQISLDVPGVKASDIQVKLEEDGKVLSLSGSRKVVREGGTYSSSFSRRFTLDPSLDTDHLTANLQNGVLTVSAPKDLKKTEETIKSIPVTEIGNAEVEEIGTEEETPNPTIHASEESTDTIMSTEQEEDAAEVDTIDLDEKN
eukprot:CAMPEP_0194209494 /NCGR_PEP_ID=MMETSP0156-20130528/7603_1 /TAXON_ID=33649 /ORGANISM="Thalassionema nitzschioides, Strain L26-B" /LENGTH=234 /DNA_ID=CAMNT_0038936681 /DNA_START=245 /DNA_END=949 /DNA_ORIENTATION=-